MRKDLFLFVASMSAVFGLTTSIPAQTLLTVEDIYGSDMYSAKIVSGIRWTPDGRYFTYMEEDEATDRIFIKRFDLLSGSRRVLVDSEIVDVLEKEGREKRFTIPNYHWSPEGNRILIPSNRDLFLFHVESGRVQRLTDDPDKERDPTFSPDGRWIAYLKRHNLVVLNIENGTESSLTVNGTEDLLIGRFDWVIEEEFSIRTGFFWSPDSRFLAYYEVNPSLEPEFPIVDFIPVHNELNPLRYPKAGDPNAVVRIGIVPVEGGETRWIDAGGENSYLPRIHWLNDSERIAVQRLNRDQNRLDLLLADVETGQTRLLLTETDSNGWVDVDDHITFLDDNRHFLWTSERSNWKHIYMYRLDGSMVRQMTQGLWDVVELEGVDEEEKLLYFTATEKNAIERHLYCIDYDGKGFRQLTFEAGTHDIRMSPACDYYLDVFSNTTTPPRTTLHLSDGRLAHIIESGEIVALEDHALARKEFLTIKTDDGLELNAAIIKPLDFDPSKKYPVLIHTYGGPGSQRVRNIWPGERGLWHQLMVQKGYLIFVVDNRGTGWKGNDFKNRVYRNMGNGVIDQMGGARYLSSLPYVDADRIGIWGWSGGGWMTCLAMTRGAEYFKAGVAVAPVTDLRNYDTIWTERYMDQPEDNPTGYDESNPMSYIDAYRGGLLLIHGDADDNVHLSNTMQMAYALQNARKPFQMMIYPRKLHGILGRDTRVHLFNTITDFLLKNL